MRHAEKVPVHVPFYDPNHKEEASTNPGACPVKGLSPSISNALPVCPCFILFYMFNFYVLFYFGTSQFVLAKVPAESCKRTQSIIPQ